MSDVPTKFGPIGKTGRKLEIGEQVDRFEPVANLFIQTIGQLDHEELWMLYLDENKVSLAYERAAVGDDHHVGVNHKVVIKRATQLNAKFIIVTHNHPNPGEKAAYWDDKPIPSMPDVLYTSQLAEVAAMFDIGVLDHLVVTDTKVTSIKMEVIGDVEAQEKETRRESMIEKFRDFMKGNAT